MKSRFKKKLEDATCSLKTPADHVKHILHPSMKGVQSRFLREQSERLGSRAVIHNYQFDPTSLRTHDQGEKSESHDNLRDQLAAAPVKQPLTSRQGPRGHEEEPTTESLGRRLMTASSLPSARKSINHQFNEVLHKK